MVHLLKASSHPWLSEGSAVARYSYGGDRVTDRAPTGEGLSASVLDATRLCPPLTATRECPPMGHLRMSSKEARRPGLVQAALAGKLTNAEAALALGLSVRQF